MVDFKFNLQFFDRQAVADKLDPAKRSALSKFGAFVRRTAKGLIRRGKRPASAGSPPKSHVGLLKNLIFFGYDSTTESVVVGPQLINSARKAGGGKTVPQLLEEGGESVTAEGKPATYRQFPYMAPALEKERDKFPGLFANSVK